MATTILNTKIKEVENKIPDNSSLVTTTVLKTKIRKVENKIPDLSKCITTQEFNNCRKLKQAYLVSKNDFHNKLISFNNKLPLEVRKNLNSLTTKDYIFLR